MCPEAASSVPSSGGASGRSDADHEKSRGRRQARSGAPLGRPPGPSPIEAMAASTTPGKVDGLGGRGLEALGGDVSAVAGQAGDREGCDHACDREHREIPPERRPVVIADVVRDVGEHPLLDVEDQLEEAPRGQRGDYTRRSPRERAPRRMTCCAVSMRDPAQRARQPRATRPDPRRIPAATAVIQSSDAAVVITRTR